MPRLIETSDQVIEISDQDSVLIFRSDGRLEWHLLKEEFQNEKDDPKGLGILVIAIMLLVENDPTWQIETKLRAQKYMPKKAKEEPN